MYEELLKKIPNDIIINHIIPYTYQKQPLCLIHDIRSYTREFKFVEDVYYTEYNPSVLICDLIRFCNNNIAPIYGIEYKYELLLRRNYVLSMKCKTDIIHYVFQNVHKNLNHKTENKIKFIWGLLTTQERLDFIAEYLLF
jgi:hypothetical protein